MHLETSHDCLIPLDSIDLNRRNSLQLKSKH